MVCTAASQCLSFYVFLCLGVWCLAFAWPFLFVCCLPVIFSVRLSSVVLRFAVVCCPFVCVVLVDMIIVINGILLYVSSFLASCLIHPLIPHHCNGWLLFVLYVMGDNMRGLIGCLPFVLFFRETSATWAALQVAVRLPGLLLVFLHLFPFASIPRPSAASQIKYYN